MAPKRKERKMKVKCQGKKYWNPNSDLDGGVNWIVLTGCGRLSDQKIFSELGLSYYYGGIGRYFTEAPTIRRVKKRVLVKQNFGWDV